MLELLYWIGLLDYLDHLAHFQCPAWLAPVANWYIDWHDAYMVSSGHRWDHWKP